MGFAMMWIMWFHSPFFGKSEIMHFVHNIGFYGVDMFLLVSGLGLYFSMRKSKSIGEFYQKRAIRILPAYLIVSICWYAFFKTEVSFGDKLLSILGVNYFRGTISSRPEYFDWFLPTLIVFYLLTPLYDKLFQKAKVKWQITLISMMISPLLCILSYHWWHNQVLYGTFVRIAVFLLGYWVGWFLYEKKKENKGSWMAYLSLLFAGIALGYYIQTYVKNPTVFWGLNCYPALMAAPALCAAISFVFDKFERLMKAIGTSFNKEKVFVFIGKIFLFPFYVFGRYSLEVYLFHQRLMEIFEKRQSLQAILSQLGVNTFSKEYYFVLALLSLALGAALHELIALVIKLFKSDTKKKETAAPVEEITKTAKA